MQNEHVHKDETTLNYDYVADGIYIGSNQCCVLGLAAVLKKEGIAADISLEEARLDQPFGVEAYLWMPIKNHTAPTSDQLSLGVRTLQTLVEQGKKVYVHCQNGHGRAPTMVVAYLISKGQGVDEAIALVTEKRPAAHLQDVQRTALENFSHSLHNS